MRINTKTFARALTSLALAALLLSAFGAMPVAAQTQRYVATAGEDTGDCTDSTDPCLTIGYAIDQAAADDTINVAAGTYEEHLVIHGDSLDGISLLGAVNADGNPATVLKLDDLSLGHGMDILDVDDVTVENFEIYGAQSDRSGIHAKNTDDILIDNVYSHNNTKDGIRVRESVGATIQNCVSKNNDGDGITFYSFGAILNNEVGDNQERGIYVNGQSVGDDRTGTVTISGNHVYNNLNAGAIGGSDARVGGIIVYSAAHDPAVLSVEIEDNVVHDNVGPGILLYKVNSEHEGGSSSNPVVPVNPDNLSSVKGNTIYSNTTRETSTRGFGDGILVYLSHYVTIEDNDIYENAEAGIRITNDYRYRIYGPTTNNTVLKNTIHGNPTAVLIQDNDNYGVTDTTVQCNDFVGNTTGVNNQAADQLDATLNWWGDVSGPSDEGPGTGDSVSTNVVFEPFLSGPWEVTPPCGTPPPGYLNVIKELDGDAECEAWSFAVEGPDVDEAFTLEDGETWESGMVQPGTYTVTETDTCGCTVTFEVDTTNDGTGPEAVVELQSGDSITVTFTNSACPLPEPVGGLTQPTDMAGLLLPWLALVGLIILGASAFLYTRRNASAS